ncbi:MAG TPA: helix-turn-helix domain-containing protein [Clostridia bacterium]|nr:helix-turn-helix domain-containing protein [Clostridia bacterium]
MVDFDNMNFAESLKESLKEAVSHAKGEIRLRSFIRSNIPVLPNIQGDEIKKIRESLDCSQSIFAEILGVSKKTVEYWEAGKNTPNGPAQRLLALMKNKETDFVKDDLQKIGFQPR